MTNDKDIDYSKYGGTVINDDIDYSKYGGRIETPQDNASGNGLFKVDLNPKERLIDRPEVKYELTHPKELGKGALEGAGFLASAIQPEVGLLRALPAVPRVLGGLGAQAGYGAMMSPDDPVLGATLNAGGHALGSAVGTLIKGVAPLFKSSTPYEEALSKATSSSDIANAANEEASSIKPGTISSSPLSDISNVEDQLGRQLNTGAAHNIRNGSLLKNRINSIEGYWRNRYKNFMDKIASQKFQMPNDVLSESYDKDAIKKAVQEGKLADVIKGKVGINNNDNPYFQHLMERAPTPNDKDASTFLSKFKDFRNTLFDLKQEIKSTSDESIRRQLIDAANRAKPIESSISGALENGLGEFSPEFKEINKGYSDQIYPLRQNRIVKKVMKEDPGKLSANMVNEFSGNGDSQTLLRDIVKQDPEMVRNIIGQRYQIKPNEVHQPNELMQEYLDELPDVKSLLTRKESILKKIASQKNITLAEKIKAETELKSLMKRKEIAKSIGLNIGYLLGGYGVYRGGKTLMSSGENE